MTDQMKLAWETLCIKVKQRNLKRLHLRLQKLLGMMDLFEYQLKSLNRFPYWDGGAAIRKMIAEERPRVERDIKFVRDRIHMLECQLTGKQS